MAYQTGNAYGISIRKFYEAKVLAIIFIMNEFMAYRQKIPTGFIPASSRDKGRITSLYFLIIPLIVFHWGKKPCFDGSTN
jgi:hypothetical protein